MIKILFYHVFLKGIKNTIINLLFQTKHDKRDFLMPDYKKQQII